jgi:hypothetical protein
MDNATATGYSNTIIGHGTGRAITSGISNTFIGGGAGGAMTSGGSCILIGYGPTASAVTGSAQIVMGDEVTGNQAIATLALMALTTRACKRISFLVLQSITAPSDELDSKKI